MYWYQWCLWLLLTFMFGALATAAYYEAAVDPKLAFTLSAATMIVFLAWALWTLEIVGMFTGYDI